MIQTFDTSIFENILCVILNTKQSKCKPSLTIFYSSFDFSENCVIILSSLNTFHTTMIEIRMSKPNGCQVLGPIFFESTTPGVFKTDIREFVHFHSSETLDQKQFLEVILVNKVNIFNNKSKNFTK